MTDWSNKEEVAAYNKAWRVANREKLRAYEKVRSALPKNVEARRAYQKSRVPAVIRSRKKAHENRAPEKKIAGYTLNNAIKLGKMARPKVCEKCGKTGRTEGHHTDYSKPLDVNFLCRPCHAKEHYP